MHTLEQNMINLQSWNAWLQTVRR